MVANLQKFSIPSTKPDTEGRTTGDLQLKYTLQNVKWQICNKTVWHSYFHCYALSPFYRNLSNAIRLVYSAFKCRTWGSLVSKKTEKAHIVPSSCLVFTTKAMPCSLFIPNKNYFNALSHYNLQNISACCLSTGRNLIKMEIKGRNIETKCH